MKNQSVSDFVAATMDAVLNSKEHKSLFDVQYKYAQDMNDAKKGHCSKCDKDMESCSCDSSMADDNDARKAKKSDDEDSSMAWDDNDARKKKKDSDEESDSSSADDDNDARKKKDSSDDDSSADDGLGSTAFDVAIDSLLTASAALDQVGLGRGSALVLKIASLTVEAKKKDKKDKDSKKKDSQSAKDKKSSDKKKSDSNKASDKKDSKKSDSKKSDSKDSKKSNPFAKKK